MNNEETPPTSYPLGRGYGHDYMRGGEVNGGYGYRDREDYARTRGGEMTDTDAQADEAESAGDDAGDSALARRAEPEPRRADPDPTRGASAADGRADAPVPQLENTFGDSGTASRYSRSFYVTQAQLQQRIYADPSRADGAPGEPLHTLRRDDDELRRDVEAALRGDEGGEGDHSPRITVEVEDGRVVLRGELPTADAIRDARDDAWSVAGVREVVSELTAREG